MKLALFAALTALTAFDVAHAAPSCATLKNVSGQSCQDFKYEIDMSACGGATVKSTPRIRCSIDQATVTFRSESNSYTAVANLKGEGWGKKSWAFTSMTETGGGPEPRGAARPVAAAAAAAPATIQITPPRAESPETARIVANEAAPTAAPPAKDTEPATAAASAPPAAAPASLEVNGYLDLYYQANLNKTKTHASRLFGKRAGVMQLNSAEATIKRKQGDVAFRIDVGAGETVDALSPSGDASRNVHQAFVTYTPSGASGLTVNAGKMYTHVGYELTRAKDNWNYTRGFLFNYAIPLWHQGLGISYALVPDQLSGGLFVYNSWDGRLNTEANSSTTLGANLSYTGLAGLTATYNYLGGPETADSRTLREVHEVILQYVINDRFAVAADVVMGSQAYAIGDESARWSAMAFYAKASIASNLAFTARYETYDDSDKGFSVAGALAAAGQKLKFSSITAGLNHDMGDGLESRLEYRMDSADEETTLFVKDDGTNSKTESSVNLALLYSF